MENKAEYVPTLQAQKIKVPLFEACSKKKLMCIHAICSFLNQGYKQWLRSSNTIFYTNNKHGQKPNKYDIGNHINTRTS